MDEARIYAGELDKLGVAYLSVTAGVYESMFTEDKLALSMQENYMADLAGSIKEVVKTPVIAAGRIAGPVAAERILSSRQADLIGLARYCSPTPSGPAKHLRERVKKSSPNVQAATLASS